MTDWLNEFVLKYKNNNHNLYWPMIIRDFTYDQCRILYANLDKFNYNECLKIALQNKKLLWQKYANYLEHVEHAGIESWNIYTYDEGLIASGATGPCIYLSIQLSRALSPSEYAYMETSMECGFSHSNPEIIHYRFVIHSDIKNEENLRSIFKLIHENTMKMYEPDGQYFNESKKIIENLFK